MDVGKIKKYENEAGIIRLSCPYDRFNEKNFQARGAQERREKIWKFFFPHTFSYCVETVAWRNFRTMDSKSGVLEPFTISGTTFFHVDKVRQKT